MWEPLVVLKCIATPPPVNKLKEILERRNSRRPSLPMRCLKLYLLQLDDIFFVWPLVNK